MYEFCARAIDDALQENPDYIVFEINTFGGRLDAAFDLVDTIMAVKGPTTIALVKKKAISAGSLIALACQKLYMLEATTIGDCAPIVQGGDGTPQIVGEKIQSPLRAKFRNLAQRNGYPELLSSAFVTPELEILELTKVRRSRQHHQGILGRPENSRERRRAPDHDRQGSRRTRILAGHLQEPQRL